eukprot:2146963-Rhodomonas_salina.1
MTMRLQDLHITQSTFCFDLAMCKSGGAIILSGFVGGLEKWWEKSGSAKLEIRQVRTPAGTTATSTTASGHYLGGSSTRGHAHRPPPKEAAFWPPPIEKYLERTMKQKA